MAKWYEQWADSGMKFSDQDIANFNPMDIFVQRMTSLRHRLVVVLRADAIPARVKDTDVSGKSDKQFLRVSAHCLDRIFRYYELSAEDNGYKEILPDVAITKEINRQASLLEMDDFLDSWRQEVEGCRRHICSIAQRRANRDVDKLVNRLCRLLNDEDKEIERIERKVKDDA